jgi:EAL domain-containing protein (putative c-di-GMP-specific phosphodiesterase class I)
MAESTRHRLELDAHLRTAVERGELWLAYQPCVHAETGELMSVEALLRWQHPHLGLVPPAHSFRLRRKRGSSCRSARG